MEIRVRRVTSGKYDMVFLCDGEVTVAHGVTLMYVLDWVRVIFSSRISGLKVGGSVNFKSEVKFM